MDFTVSMLRSVESHPSSGITNFVSKNLSINSHKLENRVADLIEKL
jgi:hypothetical protein